MIIILFLSVQVLTPEVLCVHQPITAIIAFAEKNLCRRDQPQPLTIYLLIRPVT